MRYLTGRRYPGIGSRINKEKQEEYRERVQSIYIYIYIDGQFLVPT